jgi:BON domain
MVRMDVRRRYTWAVLAVALTACAHARGEDKAQLDPFARATHGFAACPEQPPPLLSPEQARVESHVRVERGLRCAMEDKCEPGGAYKHDPEVNERMRALIAGDARFADTSIWVTTSRKWVTLQGCVRSAAQRKSLVAFIAKQPDVERVFDELSTGLPAKAPPRGIEPARRAAP